MEAKRALITVDQALSNRKPQSITALGTASRFIHPVEPVRNAWQFRGRDADSVVGDGNMGLLPADISTDRYSLML
ncbi:hypothetical protein D3C84_1126010 [compost metagenome]